MSDIAKIDPNFSVKTNIFREGLRFYPADAPFFQLYGIYYEDGKYRRLPEAVARTVNDGVLRLHANTSGGRIRFVTTSSYVAISVKMGQIGRMPHFALTGSAGFDLYEKIDGKHVFMGSFFPPYDMKDGYESIVEMGSTERHELILDFPLYSEVKELYIGLDENAVYERASEYTHTIPIVYYGSSITQGGCASRPGNAYPAMISRELDWDYINLGFSGNAKGEPEIAEYISGLDMSMFVYDYDHNAPTQDHLRNTHEAMFQKIRSAHPDIPILMLTMPKKEPRQAGELWEREQIIRATYEKARAEGDQNVYFLSGTELMGEAAQAATVDNCHPNDIGFYYMAKRVLKLIREEIQTKQLTNIFS